MNRLPTLAVLSIRRHTRRRSQLLAATLATAAVASYSSTARAGDTIQVPLRWCVIADDADGDGVADNNEHDGAPVFLDPEAQGCTDYTSCLFFRHLTASAMIWLPDAGIDIRSAIPADFLVDGFHYPAIVDPCAGNGCAGEYGDLSGFVEIFDAVHACEQAYDDLENDFGANIEGAIALSARQLQDNVQGVNGVGASVPIYPNTYPQFPGQDDCFSPPGVLENSNPYLAIVDRTFLESSTNPFEVSHEATLAHELGHMLNLGHGNGYDNDNDIGFDAWCDPGGDEDECEFPETLMTACENSVPSVAITALQESRTRAMAVNTPGAMWDPPMALEPGDVRSDHRTDYIHDVASASIDIRHVGLSHNSSYGKTLVEHALFGQITSFPASYVAFLDLDAKKTTGGKPSTLGFSTSVTGIDFITRGTVTSNGAVSVSLWRYQLGGFQLVSSSGVSGRVRNYKSSGTGSFNPQSVVVSFPSTLVPNAGPQVWMQAIASLQNGALVDRLPASTSGTVTLRMSHPEFPVCGVTPALVQAGQSATVEVAGLAGATFASFFFGPNWIATAPVSPSGGAVITFAVPSAADAATHQVTVAAVGSNGRIIPVTADCFVDVARSTP